VGIVMGCGAHVRRNVSVHPATLPYESLPLQSTVAPENWALELEQLLTTIKKYIHTERYEDVKRQKGYVNLYDINELFVTPETRGTGCGIALTLNAEQPKRAEVMLSHAWGEDVEELEDALSRIKMNSQTSVWFCLFSLYQCGGMDGDCGPTIKAQLDMQPFMNVIGLPDVEMVVVHTTRQELYERLWCVHEIDEALDRGINVEGISSKEYAAKYVARHGVFGKVQTENIVVQTQNARCSNKEDEAFIRSLVLKKGTFERLDTVILEFRRHMLESFLPELKVRPPSPKASTMLEGMLEEALTEHSPNKEDDSEREDLLAAIEAIRTSQRRPTGASEKSSESSAATCSPRLGDARSPWEHRSSFTNLLPVAATQSMTLEPARRRSLIRRHSDFVNSSSSAVRRSLEMADDADSGNCHSHSESDELPRQPASLPSISVSHGTPRANSVSRRRSERAFTTNDRRLSQGNLLVPALPGTPRRSRSRASSICSNSSSVSRSSRVHRIKEEEVEDSPKASHRHCLTLDLNFIETGSEEKEVSMASTATR